MAVCRRTPTSKTTIKLAYKCFQWNVDTTQFYLIPISSCISRLFCFCRLKYKQDGGFLSSLFAVEIKEKYLIQGISFLSLVLWGMLQEDFFLLYSLFHWLGTVMCHRKMENMYLLGSHCACSINQTFLGAWCLTNMLICLSFEERFGKNSKAKVGLYFLSENTRFDKIRSFIYITYMNYV